jgi:hypothetical protein
VANMVPRHPDPEGATLQYCWWCCSNAQPPITGLLTKVTTLPQGCYGKSQLQHMAVIQRHNFITWLLSRVTTLNEQGQHCQASGDTASNLVRELGCAMIHTLWLFWKPTGI